MRTWLRVPRWISWSRKLWTVRRAFMPCCRKPSSRADHLSSIEDAQIARAGERAPCRGRSATRVGGFEKGGDLRLDRLELFERTRQLGGQLVEDCIGPPRRCPVAAADDACQGCELLIQALRWQPHLT